MTGSDVICSVVHFVRLIKARTASTVPNTAKANLNTRIKDVGKRDTVKVAKRSRDTQEMSQDLLDKASLRKAKRKERQAGKKEIRVTLKEKD